jgi:hypothetical protein
VVTVIVVAEPTHARYRAASSLLPVFVINPGNGTTTTSPADVVIVADPQKFGRPFTASSTRILSTREVSPATVIVACSESTVPFMVTSTALFSSHSKSSENWACPEKERTARRQKMVALRILPQKTELGCCFWGAQILFMVYSCQGLLRIEIIICVSFYFSNITYITLLTYMFFCRFFGGAKYVFSTFIAPIRTEIFYITH